MNVEFTAQMETELDKVEEGELDWVDAVQDFYKPFQRDLADAKKRMRNIKGGVETGEACPECGEPLKERWGRFGKFIACSAYPECKYKKNLPGNERPEDQPTDEICPTCGKPMVIKHGRFGKFIACSGYPGVQDDQAGDPGHRVPDVRQGTAGGAALAQGPHLLRLLGLSRLQLRGVAAAGRRAVPQVRRAVPDRAGGAGRAHAALCAGGL